MARHMKGPADGLGSEGLDARPFGAQLARFKEDMLLQLLLLLLLQLLLLLRLLLLLLLFLLLLVHVFPPTGSTRIQGPRGPRQSSCVSAWFSRSCAKEPF